MLLSLLLLVLLLMAPDVRQAQVAFEAIRGVASHANRTIAEKETEEAALELMDKWEGARRHHILIFIRDNIIA